MKFLALKNWSRLLTSKKILPRSYLIGQVAKKHKIVNKGYPIPSRYSKHLFDQFFWDEFKTYAEENGAINLAEEIIWCNGCDYTKEALQNIAMSPDWSMVQYARSQGQPRLCKASAEFYDKNFECSETSSEKLKKIDPLTEIMISNGYQEGFYSAIRGIVDVGDEVVIFEPCKPLYAQVLTETGAIVRSIPLQPKEDSCNPENWILDENWLNKCLGPKTKMVIINTPQFPLGKIWSQGELECLLHYLQKHNIMVLADESQYFLAYDPNIPVHICTQKGFWERTLSIFPISDLFGLPGWNMCCLYGPSYFVRQAQIVHQDLVFTVPTPVQEAFATGFEKQVKSHGDCNHLSRLIQGLALRGRILLDGMMDTGFKPICPQAGYWTMVNWKDLEPNCDLSKYDDCCTDFKFNKWISDNLKFQGIPMTPFYADEHCDFGDNYLAFCFHNDMKRIQKVKKMLETMKNKDVKDKMSCS